MRKIAKIILVCLMFASVTSCQDDALNEIELLKLEEIKETQSTSTSEDEAEVGPGQGD